MLVRIGVAGEPRGEAKMSQLNTDIDQANLIPFPITKSQFVENKKRPLFSGPISGPMWEKISKLDSMYPDTFDWSVYDSLHNRFGDKQPRGGVVFKTGFKLVNGHSTCSKCHYTLEVDTYGRGCVHNCDYCYAKERLTQRGYWNNPIPMPVDLSKIREIFHAVFETDKKSPWREVLSQRTPLRIGSMSDSFMWMDRKFGVSLELLKILNFYKYPHLIFTRSDLIATDEYLGTLNKDLASVQFSISGLDEAITRLLEPGAPSVSRRLSALAKLNVAGIRTAVRLNPLFPTYPDGTFSDRTETLRRFNGSLQNPKIEENLDLAWRGHWHCTSNMLGGSMFENQMQKRLLSRKVAILATNGFEESELAVPKKALEDAGAEVKIVAPKDGEIRGWRDKNWGGSIPVDLSLEDADAADFDALVLPGGVMNPDMLRMNEKAIEFVQGFTRSGKPIAAICHGPWTLINADFVRGKTMTSWPSLKADLENAGAIWVDKEVQVDQGLVTSRKPDDLGAFCKKMIEEFREGIHPGGLPKDQAHDISY